MILFFVTLYSRLSDYLIVVAVVLFIVQISRLDYIIFWRCWHHREIRNKKNQVMKFDNNKHQREIHKNDFTVVKICNIRVFSYILKIYLLVLTSISRKCYFLKFFSGGFIYVIITAAFWFKAKKQNTCFFHEYDAYVLRYIWYVLYILELYYKLPTICWLWRN